MKDLLPTALAYSARGYSVIPVGADKRPLIPWKLYQTQRATPDELVKWFTDFPDAQIGIVTGEISDLTVIDIEAEGDLDFVKDETFRVRTGGGGIHVYLKYEKEFKNAVRVFPFIDQRSEGGYVVAPPSVTQKGAYKALNDLPVGKMHPDTKKAFLEAKKKELPWYANSGQTQYPKVSVDTTEYSGQSEGGRNDAMTKFAGALHAKLHQSLWASIGWQLFEQGNMKNVPPLSPYELRVIWNSIGQREVQQNPGGRDYSSYGSREKTWGPAPEKREIKPHQFEDSTSDAPEEVDPELDPKETLHASEVAAAQVIDSEHTYPLDMPPIDTALLGGFSLGEVIVVAGQSGHGKTTLIQDWSVTLSSGGQSKREKLPSLWFSYEVLAKPLWQKFEGMGATVDTPIYMPRFNESGDMDWLIEVIERAIVKWGIKVVCIDHLGFLKPPRGNYANAADAVTNTVRSLKKLAVKHGLIILLPVHIRKTMSKTPDLNDIRDSLGIAQEADTVFFIAREKDDSGLATQKAKVWLVKNRKTGTTVSALFDFEFGRYFFDATGSQKGDSVNSPAESKDEDDW